MKILLAFFVLFFSSSVFANEKESITSLIERNSEIITSMDESQCAGFALFLSGKNLKLDKPYFSRKYFLELHNYFLTLIYFNMFNEFSYSNFSQSGINNKFSEYNDIKNTIDFFNQFSINDTELGYLIHKFLEKCIPILINESEYVISDLEEFKKNSIRKLTTN